MNLRQQNEQSAGTPRKKLIMIMGVQRLGTTALFEALAGATGVTPRQESSGDEIYDNYFLRPEPEIRSALHALPGTVLLKPVRESERRTPLEVAAEYSNYDLRIIWLHRDPVNVFHSYVRLGWFGESPHDAQWFAAQWARRNGQALAAATQLKKQLIFVSYEALTSDPNLTTALAEALGLDAWTPLRRDSSAGRRSLTPETQKIIDLQTSLVSAALKRMGSIQPRDGHFLKTQCLKGFQIREGVSTGQDLIRNEPATILSGEEYIDLLSASDLGALYHRWRKSGVLRQSAETGHYAAIGFQACRLLYDNSIPFYRNEPFAWQTLQRLSNLEAFLTKRRRGLRQQVEKVLYEAVSQAGSFELSTFVSELSDRLSSIWLGLPEKESEACARAIWRMSIPGATDFPQQWEKIRLSIESNGLVCDLLGAGLILPGEVADFFRETCLPLKALQLIVENTLITLASQAEVLERMRYDPRLIRSAIDESLRLNPIFLSMKRRLVRDVEVGGVGFAQNSEVDLLAGAANRDPEIFADADGFVLDRKTPPPFLLENDSVPFMRLEDEARPGCNHLVLDAARIVIEHLLADSRDLRVEKGCYTKFQMPDGNCIQALTAARVMLVQK